MDTTKKKSKKKGGEPKVLFKAELNAKGEISFAIDMKSNPIYLVGITELLKGMILQGNFSEPSEPSEKDLKYPSIFGTDKTLA
jgi:hypothetical protein